MIRATTLFMSLALGAAVAAAAQDNPNWPNCKNNDPGTSIPACKAIIHSEETTENIGIAYAYIGDAYSREQQWDLAIQNYYQAILRKPNNAKIYNSRGTAYDHKGEHDLAIQDFDRAIQLDPNDADAFNNRGNACRSSGRYDAAIESYKESLKLDPHQAGVLNNLYLSYEHEGDFENALRDSHALLDIDPENADAIYHCGLAYAALGKYLVAIQYYDRIINNDHVTALSSNFADLYFSRGRAKMFLPDVAGTVTDFRRATEVSRSPSAIYAMLWWHIANQRLGVKDTEDFTQRAAKMDLTAWPGPVLKMYLGRMTADQLSAAAENPDAGTRLARQCDVNFYSGEYALSHQQRALGIERLTAARDGCAKACLEYDASLAELKRLSTTAASPNPERPKPAPAKPKSD